jgi:hypothetical protein
MANRRLFLAATALAILGAISLATLLFLPPVFQDPDYHNFAARQNAAWHSEFLECGIERGVPPGGGLRYGRAAVKDLMAASSGTILQDFRVPRDCK